MSILSKIDNYLQGKKSYILMLSAFIAALLGYLDGTLTLVQAVAAGWAALSLGAIKSAVAKSGPSA